MHVNVVCCLQGGGALASGSRHCNTSNLQRGGKVNEWWVTKKRWNQTVVMSQPWGHTYCHSIVHVKMVTVVIFILCVFYYNKKFINAHQTLIQKLKWKENKSSKLPKSIIRSPHHTSQTHKCNDRSHVRAGRKLPGVTLNLYGWR